jgi:ABC-type glutathione transport system ATPase component
MVPQNPLASLTYHIPVGHQIEEVLRTRGRLPAAAARQRRNDLLVRMGLPDPAVIAARYPHQLSGGQRQRVVIAAALACAPELLVLDEPTTALDKTTESQVLDLIANLRAESRAALVLVTHDLNVVARVCDRVLVMKNGRIVEQGAVENVFARPRTDYARELLGAALRIDTASAAADGGTGAALLDIDAIGFAYAKRRWFAPKAAVTPTLAGVSARIGRGEILGVIGESGSGKTTLGLVVAGLLAPNSGAVEFDGARLAGEVRARSADQRRRIQMVFQDPLSSLNPRQTVGAAVMRPLTMFFGLDRRTARRRAAALFAALGLEETLMSRYPRQLSGGQQQRVAIARAFAAEPDLLVCDEITSALDASIQAQVLELLLAMQRRTGAAMMVITHDLSVIWKLAPRVVVMQGGKVIEAGATEAVFRAPRSAYTAGLVAAATSAGRFYSDAAAADPSAPVLVPAIG